MFILNLTLDLHSDQSPFILSMKSSIGAAEPGTRVPSGPQPPLGCSSPGQDAGWAHSPTCVTGCGDASRVRDREKANPVPLPPSPSSLRPSCVSGV